MEKEIFGIQNNGTFFVKGQPIQDGSCVRTDCHLLLSDCPKNEKCELGDLTVKGRNNNIVACLSPCKKWNYPTPYGYGRDEQQGDGRMLCCPDPVTPEDCRKGIVAQTDYVNLLHRACKTAYSYSYDDEGGLHTCPSQASFVVNYSSWVAIIIKDQVVLFEKKYSFGSYDLGKNAHNIIILVYEWWKWLNFFSKFAPVYFSEESHKILLTQWVYGTYLYSNIYLWKEWNTWSYIAVSKKHGAIIFEWYCEHFAK